MDGTRVVYAVSLVAHLIEPLFSWMGPGREVAIHSVALTLAFILITMLHIVLGELAPKTLAIQRAELTALWVAWPIRTFNALFKLFTHATCFVNHP